MLVMRKAFFMVIDALIVNLAAIIAFGLRFEGIIPAEYWTMYVKSSLLLTGIYLLSFHFFGIYKRIWKYASTNELLLIFKATAFSTLIMGFIFYFVMVFRYPRSVMVMLWILTFLGVGASRFIFKYLNEEETFLGIKNGQEKESSNGGKRLLIIGAGEAGAALLKDIRHHQEYVPVGFIDDNPAKQKLSISGCSVLGDRYQIPKIVDEYQVEEAIIAIPTLKAKEVKEFVELCRSSKCRVRILPSLNQLISGEVTVSQVRDVEVEDLLGRDPVEVDLEEMSSYLKGQVILVTGAGGSIGSELCRQIMRFSPKRLLLLDNNENNLYEIEIELKNQYNEKLIYPIVASIQDSIRIDEVFANFRPAIVFHAAAHKHVPLMELNPQEAVKNNIFGTKIVAEAADNYNCKRFVLISTDKAVNPTSVMGATKRIAEMIIQDLNRRSKTKYAAVRFGNVLGSNGSVIPLFKKQISQGGPVTVTHPEMVRFFMTIPEAVQLVIQAGAMGEGGEIFVLDMGEPVKIVDLASELIRLSGLEPGEDIEIKFIGIRPGEKLYEEVLTAEEGTKATKHRRIFVAKSNKIDSIKLGNTIQMLASLVNEAKSDILIKQIENLVSTYRPNRTNLVHLFNEGEAVNDWLIKRQ